MAVSFGVTMVESAATKGGQDNVVLTQGRLGGLESLLHNVCVEISPSCDTAVIDVLLLPAFSEWNRALVLTVAEGGVDVVPVVECGGDMVIATKGGVDVVEGESVGCVKLVKSPSEVESVVTASQLEVLVTVTVRIVLDKVSTEASPGGLVCHVQSTTPWPTTSLAETSSVILSGKPTSRATLRSSGTFLGCRSSSLAWTMPKTTMRLRNTNVIAEPETCDEECTTR